MKIVINNGVGGFQVTRQGYKKLIKDYGLRVYCCCREGLSREKYREEKMDALTAEENTPQIYCEKATHDDEHPYWTFNLFCMDELRTDENLIRFVENEKDEYRKNLRVIEIPDDVEYCIKDRCDGVESIHEEHRAWGAKNN